MLQLLRKFIEPRIHFVEFVAGSGLLVRLAGSFARRRFALTRIAWIAPFAGRVARSDGCGIGFALALVRLVACGIAIGIIIAPGLARRGVADVTIRVVFALGSARGLSLVVVLGFAERFGVRLRLVLALIAVVAAAVAIPTAFKAASARFVVPRGAKWAAFVRTLGAAVVSVAIPITIGTTPMPPVSLRIAVRAAFAPLRRTERGAFAVISVRPPVRLVFAIAAFDDAVEPVADRNAGALPAVPGSLMGSRTTTSEIPRTARFHSRAQTAGAACARCRAGPRQGQCERHGLLCLFGRLLRNRVNSRLKRLPGRAWRGCWSRIRVRPVILDGNSTS